MTTHTLEIQFEKGPEPWPRWKLVCSDNGGPECVISEQAVACWPPDGEECPEHGTNFEGLHYHKEPVGSGCVHVLNFEQDPGVFELCQSFTVGMKVTIGDYYWDEMVTVTPIAGVDFGDRVEDGGMLGTIVRCETCGGSGQLHEPDEVPEPVAPEDGS